MCLCAHTQQSPPPHHPSTPCVAADRPTTDLREGEEHDVANEANEEEVEDDEAAGGHGGVVVAPGEDGHGGGGAGVEPDLCEEDGEREGDDEEGEEAVDDGTVLLFWGCGVGCTCVFRGRRDANEGGKGARGGHIYMLPASHRT